MNTIVIGCYRYHKPVREIGVMNAPAERYLSEQRGPHELYQNNGEFMGSRRVLAQNTSDPLVMTNIAMENHRA